MSYLGQDPSLEVCLSAQHHLPVCSAPSLLSFLALLCRLLPLGPEEPRNPSASPQVLSGCAIIVRGQPRGGPPPERQINLSNIRAGNLARRAAAGQPDAKDTPDEVGASHEQCRAAPPLSQGSRVELDGGCVWGGGLQAAGPALQTTAPSAHPLQGTLPVPRPAAAVPWGSDGSLLASVGTG